MDEAKAARSSDPQLLTARIGLNCVPSVFPKGLAAGIFRGLHPSEEEEMPLNFEKPQKVTCYKNLKKAVLE
ncbi:hypothetical protein NECAME_19348 [Necator americanus]|uniref:Uncharacterized protein n=1 Tax=Necator americanus TaxID=51031 RepID=W2SRV3_NECAM|nr:hypothetical protein NECAME_19348 [Necator americanus]ETN71427.1 hypothetical protein NECAME_19348 [Necator americanus]